MKFELQQINDKVETFQSQLKIVSTEYDNYVRRFDSNEFVVNEKEEIESEITKAENMLDRFQEMYIRNTLVLKNCSELVSSIDEMKETLQKFISEREAEGNDIGMKNNNIIEMLKELCNKEMNIILEPFLNEIEKIKGEFQERKDGWDDFHIDTSKYIEKKELEEKIEIINNSMTNEEINKIEEWTNMNITELVFDSDNDDWTQENGVFNEKIVGKEKLVFLITDNIGNKFGGFVNEKIVKENQWISDPNAFLFSLKKNRNNNRNNDENNNNNNQEQNENNNEENEMKKFDVNDPQKVFYLWKKESTQMFGFGSGIDIGIYKKSNKESSWCNQSSERTFNYQQMHNIFIENNDDFSVFTPERICVFRME